MEGTMKKQIIKNEKQFADWFKKNYKKLGFSKMVRGDISRCPDFVMLRENKPINVELETIASNFLVHKHDFSKVDEIWCIIKDVNLDKPVRIADNIIFKGKRKVTFSIESKTYDDFKEYCEKNAIMVSKKIEIWIDNFLKEVKHEKKK